jgi:hypothetical protein
MERIVISLNTKAKQVRHLVAVVSAVLVALNAGFQIAGQASQLLQSQRDAQERTQEPISIEQQVLDR